MAVKHKHTHIYKLKSNSMKHKTSHQFGEFLVFLNKIKLLLTTCHGTNFLEQVFCCVHWWLITEWLPVKPLVTSFVPSSGNVWPLLFFLTFKNLYFASISFLFFLIKLYIFPIPLPSSLLFHPTHCSHDPNLLRRSCLFPLPREIHV